MHERDRGLGRSIGQIRIEAAHLRRDKHALVDDRAAAHRADIEDLARKRALSVGLLLDDAAADIERTLERLATLHVLGTAQECLDDCRHACPGGLAEVVGIRRNRAPEEQRNALLGAAILEYALCDSEALFILREEEHSDTVVALIRQKVAIALCLAAEEAVRHLEQDAGAVAGIVLEALAATVLEVHKDAQGVVDHLVGTLALQMGKRADAAGIMLELGTVESLVL